MTKHTNPNYNRRARAPYNFVPLPERMVAVVMPLAHDQYHKGAFTGRIECTLETCSPVYIRGMMTAAAFGDEQQRLQARIRGEEQEKAGPERDQPDFFSTDNHTVEGRRTPVIPGSSLRGMVRTLVEIIGHGRMRWVTNSPLIFRSVGDPTSIGNYYRQRMLGGNKGNSSSLHFDYPSMELKGGYLWETSAGWAIKPAKQILNETFVHVEYQLARPIIGGQGRWLAHEVFVSPAPRSASRRPPRGSKSLILDLALTSQISNTPGPGLVPAVLVESGHMGGRNRKHWHCAIFEPDVAAANIPIPADKWRAYVSDRDATRGIQTQTRKLLNHGDALFYLVDKNGELVFFGSTMMFRIPYENTPKDLIPRSRRRHATDLADAIFGWVEEEDEGPREQFAGRVFFEDARFERADNGVWYTDEPLLPHVLATPKPTTFQHYLVQNRGKGHDPDRRETLAHYGTSLQETQIRGYKMYWHKGSNPELEASEEEKAHPTQLTQIRPVKPGVHFRFTIHFENLREYELGALLWALALPGEAGIRYCHKLGMGKPLGMGAVSLVPHLYLSNRQRTDDEANGKEGRSSRYEKLFAGNQWHLAESKADHKPYINIFEQAMMHVLRKDKQPFRDEKRIEMLLAMLQWREGDAAWLDETRYMEIEREPGKVNEYKERPVLPDPLEVSKHYPR